MIPVTWGFRTRVPYDTVSFAHRNAVKRVYVPSGPYSMNLHSLSNIDNQWHIGVIIVIRSSWNLSIHQSQFQFLGNLPSKGTYLNILIRHPDVVCIRLQILRCGHNSKLYSPFVTKRLKRPFPNTSNLLDRGDSIVGDEDLSRGISHYSPNRQRWREAYGSNAGVSTMLGHEILHSTRRSYVYRIASYEV